MPCPRCPELEAELAQAYREIGYLRREVQELKREVQRLRAILQGITDYCMAVRHEAQPTLSKSSGVPRGKYAWEHSRVDVANEVLGCIGFAVE